MAIEHDAISNAELHEPKGVSGASANQVYLSDGAGSGSWSQLPGIADAAHISIQNADLGKGATAPTEVVVGNYTGWQFTIGDDSVITIELPHNLDSSSDIGIHLTWAINEAYATANAEVQFQVDWSLIPYDETESLSAPTHTGTITTGDQNIPATAYHVTHDTMTIDASNVADLDTLGFTLSRVALDAGTNPTAEPVVIAVHVEYTTKSTV